MLSLEQRAACLRELVEAAQFKGLGVYGATEMTVADAIAELQTYRYFDYLWGRALHVKIPDRVEDFDFRLYDHFNGPGVGAAAVARALAPVDGAR